MCSVAFYLCLQAEMVPLKSELLSLETSEYNRKKGGNSKENVFYSQLSWLSYSSMLVFSTFFPCGIQYVRNFCVLGVSSPTWTLKPLENDMLYFTVSLVQLSCITLEEGYSIVWWESHCIPMTEASKALIWENPAALVYYIYLNSTTNNYNVV